ncbi:unnamed protein product [Lymnaea stagnalis]|uniref:Rho-GAP domain-containing protein n=1 Tax=Lymnaea stagnalis TaxID=6523 RepID=A0AAV2IJZ4_LYMST
MMFVLRQRAAAFPTRHLTSIYRCKKERIACGVAKYGQSQPSTLQYFLSDEVQARQNLCSSQAENVWKSPNLINSALSQQDNRIQVEANNTFPLKDVKKEIVTVNSIADSNLNLLQCLDICLAHKLNGIKKFTNIPSPSTWLPNYNQKGRLLDGLFGNGRQDLLSYTCRGLHLAPTQYCKIPAEFSQFKEKFVKYHPLGDTHASDLCAESQIRLKEIAHEHLKRVLRECNVNFVKNKPKKYPDMGIFKSPLLAQVERDVLYKKSINRVPALLRYFITEIVQRDLDTVGIFRMSGSHPRIQELKSILEKKFYDPAVIDTSKYDIHDFTTLMKEYLRELPAKLISTEKFEIYPDIEELPFKKKQYNIMNYFMLSMTPEHRETTQYLLSFLEEVANHSDKNKMGPDNLATVFAPNVFKIGKIKTDELQNRMQIHNRMFAAWLYYYRHISIVSDLLMNDLRKSFGSKPAKIKFDSKLFPQLPKPPAVPENLESLTDATITVLTPYEAQPSKEIKIGVTHTAQQVVLEVLGNNPPADGAVAAGGAEAGGAEGGAVGGAEGGAVGGAEGGAVGGAEGGAVGGAVGGAEQPVGTVSSCYFTTQDFERGDEKAKQYLYEVGGNMGERCLHPDTNLLNVYKANPKAYWIVKSLGKPPSHVVKKFKLFK